MRILLLSYHFPPYNAVGSVRPGKFAKFFHQRGHEVHVIAAASPPFSLGQLQEIPEACVSEVQGWSVNAPIQWLLGGRKQVALRGYMGNGRQQSWQRHLAAWYKTLLHWPDAEVGWASAALAEGRRQLAQRNFDVIYVSAPPFSALRVGSRLSRESKIPWVAEFRDLWSDNHAYAHPGWRRIIERYWEERILCNVSALVTVSPPLAQTLARFGKPVWEIRNGFDPDDLRDIAPPSVIEANKLVIAYTGNIYPEHHDVDTFCKGLELFRAKGGDALVNVAGRNIAPLMQAAHKHGVSDWFNVRATVARHSALEMQCAADVLLMFLWQGNADGVYTTKLFEYAGTRRPILAVGSIDTDVARWIGETRIGNCAATAMDVAALLASWQQRKHETGPLLTQPSPDSDFTRTTQFLRLETKLLKLIDDAKNCHE